MRAALEFELLKARRSLVFWWGAVAVAVGVPALCTLFFTLARTGGTSPGAVKAAALVTTLDLPGLVGLAGQVLSVAVLLAAGVAASWSFGREYVDGAMTSLFATGTPRPMIAAAKFLVLLVWSLAAVLASAAITILLGLMLELNTGPALLEAAGRAIAAGLLAGLLALPLALVASWRRGYLAGFVVLLLVVVATQVITATGGGHWFPYAVPSLWSGMGGVEAAEVTPLGLLTVPLLATLSVGLTLLRWGNSEEP